MQRRNRRIAIVANLALAGFLVGSAGAQARTATRHGAIKGRLYATNAAPDADGTFERNLAAGPNESSATSGQLKVKVRNLTPQATFGIVLGGTSIGMLRTMANGKGRTRFRTTPHGRDQKLAVDPRGQVIAVTDALGTPVLEGEVSDSTTPGGIQCCLDTADEQRCDVLLPAACAAAGGTAMAAGACEPDPCPGQSGDGESSDDDESDDDGLPAAGSLR